MSSNVRVLSSGSLTYLQLTGNSLEIRDGCRTISLRSISSANSDETIEVTDALNSIQSLRFCGFSDGAATQIYNRWALMERDLTPHDLGYGQHIVKLAREYISHRAGTRNAFVEGDDWVGALQFMGVKSETRNAIMDPDYQYLRLSASASKWVLNTLNSCWEFLEGLDSQVRKREEEHSLRASGTDQ